MNEPKQLIIHFDKTILTQALIVLPAVIIASLFTLSIVNPIQPYSLSIPLFLGSLILFLIKTFLYFCIGFFSIGGIFSLWYIITTSPVAILDQHGIWVNHYGSIPWSNIKNFAPYSAAGNGKLMTLGIMLKDPKILAPQADWYGNLGLFWAKVFRYNHINLSGLNASNESVVAFAQQYLNKE